MPTHSAINEKMTRKMVRKLRLFSISVWLWAVISAEVSVSATVGSSVASIRVTNSSAETLPSPCTSTASMKPGLAMNSSAVGASNNAHVALPGEMMSSYSMMPTSTNDREPLSELTFTVSPSVNPPSAAVSVSSATSPAPTGRRPSFTFQIDSSPSFTVAPNVGAVGRSIGVPSSAITTASP